MFSTVSAHIAAVLKRYGVEDIFGQSIPSELLLAAEEIGIRQVFYRTENAGGAMADGYARITNRVGVVTAQNGPAATLLVAPLAEALKASIPMLAIVQEVPRGDRDRNAFQELDHELLFAGCSKSILRVDDPARVEADLALAFTRATSGRPGPVVILVPRDVLSAPAVEQTLGAPGLGSFPLDRPRPARTEIQAAAALLARARNPLVVAGGGVHGSGASAQLALLQETASLPVATTNMGKGSVDETHELSVGVIGSAMGVNSYTYSLRPVVAEADVVLLIGTRTNENGTDGWSLMPKNARFIHLDITPDEVSRNYESLRLVGDARSGLEDLLEAMKEQDLSLRNERRAAVVGVLAEAHAKDREAARAVLESNESPLRPERIMAELDRLITPDDIVVADASYSTLWVTVFLQARRAGQRFVTPRGLAGLGWGFPMALGVKVARPDARVICLVGDGGFGHTWQELETAVRESMTVTVILLNNGILGFQKHAELHNYGAHTSAVHFSAVDHAEIARACGANGVRVTDVEELAPALARALESDVPTLIEVMVDAFAHPPIAAWDGSEALRAV